jgi:hypothetical protein
MRVFLIDVSPRHGRASAVSAPLRCVCRFPLWFSVPVAGSAWGGEKSREAERGCTVPSLDSLRLWLIVVRSVTVLVSYCAAVLRVGLRHGVGLVGRCAGRLTTQPRTERKDRHGVETREAQLDGRCGLDAHGTDSLSIARGLLGVAGLLPLQQSHHARRCTSLNHWLAFDCGWWMARDGLSRAWAGTRALAAGELRVSARGSASERAQERRRRRESLCDTMHARCCIVAPACQHPRLTHPCAALFAVLHQIPPATLLRRPSPHTTLSAIGTSLLFSVSNYGSFLPCRAARSTCVCTLNYLFSGPR